MGDHVKQKTPSSTSTTLFTKNDLNTIFLKNHNNHNALHSNTTNTRNKPLFSFFVGTTTTTTTTENENNESDELNFGTLSNLMGKRIHSYQSLPSWSSTTK